MKNGHDILRAFRRTGSGSWICFDSVTIDHPVGRIQVTSGTKLMPGTIFMGVDLAAWLTDQFGSGVPYAAE